MGATRQEVSRVIRMECGCLYQYSVERFVRGERVFECAHKRTWKISVVTVPIKYVVEDVTPVEVEDG